MNMNQIITQYIAYRKSLGEKFKTNEMYLKYFCKKIGEFPDIKEVTEDMVNDFLYGDSMIIKSGWFVKHSALLGFYKYALTCNYIDSIPLPSSLPKKPQSFVPYIYSRDELKLLFSTALNYQKNKSCHSTYMAHVILVLTYSLGLRIQETLSILLGDINISYSVLTINKSKFYTSRLVPFNPEIKEIIDKYLQ